jgi:hypothetical protein
MFKSFVLKLDTYVPPRVFAQALEHLAHHRREVRRRLNAIEGVVIYLVSGHETSGLGSIATLG